MKDLSLTARCPFHRTLDWLEKIKRGGLWKNRPAFASSSPRAQKILPAADPGTPRCPLGYGANSQDSIFIAQAQKEAAEAKVIPGDPEANALLQKTRDSIYHWPAQFKGFQAQLKYQTEHGTWHGTLRADSSRQYQLELSGCPDTKWVQFQIEELISHREAPQKSRMASRSGVTFGDDHAIYGQKVVFCGDKMGSYYRLKDHKITQIHRAYGRQNFVINIDLHHQFHQKFAAAAYTAFYRDNQTNLLTKVETYLDRYEEVTGLFLPASRQWTEAQGERLEHRLITFEKLTLL